MGYDYAHSFTSATVNLPNFSGSRYQANESTALAFLEPGFIEIPRFNETFYRVMIRENKQDALIKTSRSTLR